MCELIVDGACVVTHDEWWRVVSGYLLALGVGSLLMLFFGD